MNREDLIAALEKAAEEIARDGHMGWGNVCLDAAAYLKGAPSTPAAEPKGMK